MDRLIIDLRVAARTLARQPAFSLVAVLTLALGLGATTAIFSVVYGILIRPLPYVQSDRIVALGQTSKRAPSEPVDGSSSHLNFMDWKRRSRTIPLMALYAGGRATITNQGEAEVVRIGSVTPDFFEVFKAAPVRGRGFTPIEDLPNAPRVAIVSYGFWQERFGGRDDILSQSVEIGGALWSIVGVAPRGFDFPAGARLWIPVRNDDQRCGRGCVFLNGIGRLSDGVNVPAAQQEMTSIAAALEREYPNANFDTAVMVQTLHDRTVGNVRFALLVLLAAVGMVLLIACANVANLVLVRGAARRTEIAVRAALGAGRRGLVSYLLTENLVLALAGGALGLVIALWGIDVLKAMAANVPRLDDVRFDAATFLFAVAIVFATTVLFGFGPSLQLSRIPLGQALGQRGRVGAGHSRWTRSILLMGEVTLSLVLLLAAGLLLRSLKALQDTDPGFDPSGLTVFTISLPPARYPTPEQAISAHERLDEQLAAVPGVTQVARISGLPLGPSENVFSFTRPDQPPPPPGQAPIALYRVVDAGYFRTMKIPVLDGRAFLPADRAGAQRVVVISRRMAETFWPNERAVGRPIQISGFGSGVVVGVVENVRSQTLAQQAQPEMYVPHAQSAARTVTYVVKSTLDHAHALSAARDVVRRFDARVPLIAPGPLNDLVHEQLARPRFYLLLIGLFAVLASVLAAVGIYGVVAYVVSQRTREIGVRMALGASRQAVVRMILWQGLTPAVVGIAMGLAIALALGRLIRGLLYEIQPDDPVTMLAVSVVMLGIVFVACAIPARRASGVPPAEALRSE